MSRTTPPPAADAASLVAEAVRAQHAGRVDEAVRLLVRALAARPDDVDALRHYAVLALAAGHARHALPAAQRWSELRPRSAEAKNALAIACRECGRLEDAIARLREAVALAPSFFDARVNLGNALLDAGDAAGALAQYERARAMRPAAAAVHNNLGNAHRELREPAKALAAYRRALELDPGHARAHANAGTVLRDVGDTDAAIAAFRRALELAPNRADVWSDLLLALNGSDRVSADELAREHRAFGEHFARLIAPLAPAERPPGARLRVGYVSSDFRRHAVAAFFEPLAREHDRSRFEVFCYYTMPRGDDVTARIRDAVEHFVPVSGSSDAQLAARIRADGIDVLIDLNGHTAGNRLSLFFLRPAPVQATWLGYLGPTGVPTIGWRVTDAHVDPPDAPFAPDIGAAMRLPRTLWCYQPHAQAPDVAPLPCANGAPLTFGCLNNPGKASPTAIALWAAVLRRVPGSRLLLLAPRDAPREAALRQRFVDAGVGADRIELVARMPIADYLALHARVDVGLDTHPYAGGTTTCDALWMGVPVVTLAGDRPFARTGASVLAQVGLDECVAASGDAYVDAAVSLACDRARLAALRAGLRERMRASPLTDAAAFAREFEAALVAMANR
jgi:predicted O-linked N-acetylglucosamine transferase (SPINDLY family)